jgi:hypothetical protein
MLESEKLKKIIRISPDYTTITYDDFNKNTKKLTPVIQQNEVLTDNFIDNCNQLINSVNTVNFILPSKCKYVKQYSPVNNDQEIMFIIEEEPLVRTIRVNLSMEAPLQRLRLENKLEQYGYKDFQLKQLGEPYLFTLSFPYIIHILMLHLFPESQPRIDHYVFYKLSPLQSTFDYLIRPNLPNIDGSFRVCAGEYELNETSIPGIIQQYLVHFWSSIFNKDYLVHYLAYTRDEILTDFLQWQYHSKQNPKCIFNIGWEQCGKLNDKIQSIEKYHSINQNKYVDLFKLYELATSAKLEFNKDKPKVAFSNWIDSMWIEKYMISIGDELKIKNKVFYVKDFLKDLRQQEFIVIEDSKGKLFRLKNTESLRQLLLKEHLNEHLEFSATINGETYTKGDTIIITVPGNTQQYATIESFSKSKLGKLLVTLHNGSKYYVEHVKMQKFDRFNMTINNVHFEANKTYLFFDKFPVSISTYRERIFKEAVLDFGDLRLDFLITGSSGRPRTYGVSMYELSRYQIVPTDDPELSQVPELFSFGRIYKSTFPFLSYKGNIYSKDVSDPVICNFEQIKQYVNNVEVHFPKLKPFKIGDQVAIALWKEPLEMIKRRVITRIITDDEKKEVRIETTDGVTTRQDIMIKDQTIHYASFRHIINDYDGLVAGTVFKPTSAGIPCFPKKSNYRLIGFIETGCTNFPMMALMSNCCTLWPFQLKNDFFVSTDINVENPTIDKIKFQDLDMYYNGYGEDDGVETTILLYNINYAGLRQHHINYLRISGGASLTTNPTPSSRIGFIYPRKHQYGNYVTKFGGIDGLYQLNFYNDRDVGRFRLVFDRRLFENV